MAFSELLDNPEARALIDEIEELEGEKEPCLVRIRNERIAELAEKYGYCY